MMMKNKASKRAFLQQNVTKRDNEAKRRDFMICQRYWEAME